MIWRILGGIAGVGVVGAATHLNVMHASGYRAEDAPLIIAVAILVAFGMGFVSWAFSEGFRSAAVLLALLLLVGEGYWVLTNADRELVTRKAQAAPIADALLGKARQVAALQAPLGECRVALTAQILVIMRRRRCLR